MHRLKPAKDVVTRRLDDERVLVHLGTSTIYSLNETGARFWELVSEGRRRPDVETVLCEEFAVEPAALRRELDRLAAELLEGGLLVAEEEEGR